MVQISIASINLKLSTYIFFWKGMERNLGQGVEATETNKTRLWLTSIC